MAKRRGQSAAFMRSINPHLRHRKIYKRGSISLGMAKRRRSSRFSRKRSFRRTAGIGAKVILIGGLGYMAYKAFLAPKIPLSGIALGVTELAAGYYLSKRSGFVGDLGKVMFVVSGVSLLSSVALPALGGSGILATQNTGGAYY